ncbi:uncharacterized protein PADG_04428 [Paracoccidioides brasiliensis Pb18]|uniref:Zn(2)-C6 fungal-type domain-containing protein n=1 Tax=Paracoccidioides brasiliensis (strain Pb18) TaxID=502780 RepID=C1GAZ2_PARBD|nr:uncharacterized protein PADG_04428 [Paracoccidioides brasiliensis Pb18]EEH48344.2 hypothetical protein PADG_04428 [Paracoccidioides brasiliensis Pb18]
MEATGNPHDIHFEDTNYAESPQLDPLEQEFLDHLREPSTHQVQTLEKDSGLNVKLEQDAEVAELPAPVPPQNNKRRTRRNNDDVEERQGRERKKQKIQEELREVELIGYMDDSEASENAEGEEGLEGGQSYLKDSWNELQKEAVLRKIEDQEAHDRVSNGIIAPMEPGSNSNTQPSEGKDCTLRTLEACNMCKMKKTKCDGTFPRCKPCVRARVVCCHTNPFTGHPIPRGDRQRLRKEKKDLIKELRKLRWARGRVMDLEYRLMHEYHDIRIQTERAQRLGEEEEEEKEEERKAEAWKINRKEKNDARETAIQRKVNEILGIGQSDSMLVGNEERQDQVQVPLPTQTPVQSSQNIAHDDHYVNQTPISRGEISSRPGYPVGPTQPTQLPHKDDIYAAEHDRSKLKTPLNQSGRRPGLQYQANQPPHRQNPFHSHPQPQPQPFAPKLYITPQGISVQPGDYCKPQQIPRIEPFGLSPPGRPQQYGAGYHQPSWHQLLPPSMPRPQQQGLGMGLGQQQPHNPRGIVRQSCPPGTGAQLPQSPTFAQAAWGNVSSEGDSKGNSRPFDDIGRPRGRP